MKMKSLRIYFLYVIGYMCLNLSVASSAEVDPYSNVRIPIFQGSYALQKSFDASKETKSIRYSVQITYPPAEVLEFYDTYFNGRGWRPSFEICQRNWEVLSQETKAAEPIVNQLFASWEHPELDLKAVLWITYETADNKVDQTEVIVKCRLQPKDN